jgi:hypothetical protein
MSHSHQEIEAIRTIVSNVAHHIDGKRWAELRALFAATVHTDYTSLFGGTPQKQGGDELIAGWRGVLEKVTTQHLLGPILVRSGSTGDEAQARCHVRAMHYAAKAPSGEHWEVGGHYVFSLALEGTGWKIGGMTLETFFQTGNVKLLAEVSAPAK